MGLHERIAKILGANKTNVAPGSDSKKSTPDSATPASTPSASSSRASSLYHEPINSPTPNEKYLRDPMRHNKRPDTLGSFVDPMGGRHAYARGYDATNTGA
ncbi:hypothetical protein VTP01DRAFT_10348 [Rhizomucor pusillus]|uniref:uncharacterized protein n=1 Tax=Rhizomucor pusillus TaxID=4840 RepID=UPI003743399F